MSRYRIELANTDDDSDLRAVLAAIPIPGVISISLNREPSYFRAGVVDGRFRQVVIARESSTGQVVGCGSRSVSLRYANGKPTSIGYLSNLRLLPEHRYGRLIARGYSFLRELHQDRRTPLYLTTITQDNQPAAAILTSGRAGLPTYHSAGRYHTMAFPLTKRPKMGGDYSGVEVRSAQTSDIGTILDFVTTVGRRRQFFPCYEPQDVFASDGLLSGLQPEDLLLAFRSGRLVGTLGAWDQRAFRQTVLHSYGKPLCWLRTLYNGWAWLRELPRLPRPGRALACLAGVLPLVDDDDPRVFAALFDAMTRVRSGRTWDYLLIGMHEADPLLSVLEERHARRYTTCMYLACWDDGEELRKSLDARPPYLELGSL